MDRLRNVDMSRCEDCGHRWYWHDGQGCTGCDECKKSRPRRKASA